MIKVLVLGGTGMLGSMLVDWLSRQPGIELHASARSARQCQDFADRIPSVRWQLFDVVKSTDAQLVEICTGMHWVVNCIGIIKPYIRDDMAREVVQAIAVNSVFPHRLAQATAGTRSRVIQIATDCAYRGQAGCYSEDALHNASDVYGKSKSLGEVCADHFFHLRCSIVGIEPRTESSLLGWFLSQPKGGVVNGYSNHLWNGITTFQFAKLCQGMFMNDSLEFQKTHVVPSDTVNKFQLLTYFSESFNRSDLSIRRTDTELSIDRTLHTNNLARNSELWRMAGYPLSPSIKMMVSELADHDFRFAKMA